MNTICNTTTFVLVFRNSWIFPLKVKILAMIVSLGKNWTWFAFICKNWQWFCIYLQKLAMFCLTWTTSCPSLQNLTTCLLWQKLMMIYCYWQKLTMLCLSWENNDHDLPFLHLTSPIGLFIMCYRWGNIN